MTRSRDVAVLVLTAAALGLSVLLCGRLAGFSSPWVMLLAMIEFLGLVRVARPLFLLTLPRPMRAVRSWELTGGTYRALGVSAYGALLRRTPLRFLNPHVYLRGSASVYEDVCVQAESAEAAHLWAIVLTIPYLAYAGISHQWTALLLFAAAHLGVNVYPVLHLRLVRGRLQQVLARKRARPRPPERVRPTH